MPVYAYACSACGHAFDARQSFTEPALTICEQCGGALRKQYGSIGVTFNGTGFYRTDSRAAANAAGQKSSSSKPSGTSPSGTSPSSGSSSSSSAAKTSAAPSGGNGSAS